MASQQNSSAAPVAAQAGTLHPSRPAVSSPEYNRFALERSGMQYCRLGTTGAVISRVGLGLMSYASAEAGEESWNGWSINNEAGEAYIEQALEAGINFFDTAEIYSNGRSEVLFGRALKRLLEKSKFTRSDLIISSKIHPFRTLAPGSDFGGLQKGLSRKAIFAAVEGSLQRLQLDYLDIYFIHRYDPSTSAEETMRALHDLVVSGKVRYLGASSMYVWQFAKLQQAAKANGWTQFSVMQNHYNAIYREEEREMIPYCVESGVACTPYSPLASGVMLRPVGQEADTQRGSSDRIQKIKYFKSGDEAVSAAVQAVAAERGVPPAQVALAWILSKPGIASPIIGATKPHHIPDAVAAVSLRLTEEEIARIEKDYQPHAISGHA